MTPDVARWIGLTVTQCQGGINLGVSPRARGHLSPGPKLNAFNVPAGWGELTLMR